MLLFIASLFNIAEAGGKVTPYMNGIGPSVHSMVFPQQFPATFPKYKDVNGDKQPSNLEKVKLDAALGLKGTMYINRQYRATFNPYYHKSFLNDAGYSAIGLNFGVDKTAYRERNVLAYYGVNLGKDWLRFNQTEQGKGSLTAEQLYIQPQVGATYFNRKSAYELALYARIGLTGVESYALAGTTYEGDTLGNGIYSPTIGLQGTYYVGDFRAIHNNKGKNKKKGNGKKKGKGKKKNR
jgi:hypothetical protein